MSKTHSTAEGHLAETLNAILTDLHEASKSAAGVAGRELSLLAEEVLMYGAFVALAWLAASLLVIGLAWKLYSLSKMLGQKWVNLKEEMTLKGYSRLLDDRLTATALQLFGVYVGITVFTVIGGVVLMVNGMELGKVLLAPRLYLLEYTASLLK